MYYHDENLCLFVISHMNIKANMKCCVEIKNCFGYLQGRLLMSNGTGDKSNVVSAFALNLSFNPFAPLKLLLLCLSTLIGMPSFFALHQWYSPHLIKINGRSITDLSDAGTIPSRAYPNQSDHHH